MDTSKLVMAIISITVGIIIIATVLLPTIADATAEGKAAAQYATLLGVVGTMVIVAVVMMAVRLMSGRE